MELHLGKMSSKELAEWFGISYSNYRNTKTKEKKLKELESFADFEEVYGGVNILKIKNPEYSKKATRKHELLEKVFLEEWDNEKHNNINTCANVARKIEKKYGEDLDWTLGTIENYGRAIRKKDFGVPFFSDGEKGSCGYLWAKIIPVEEDVYVCERLSDKEIEIKNRAIKKIFCYERCFRYRKEDYH